MSRRPNPKPPADPIDLRRAAEILDLHRDTLYRWARAGRLGAYRTSARSPWRFSRSAVQRLADRMRHG